MRSTTRRMTYAAAIARALGGRKSGAGWVCKCVAHDDRSPSLSICDGKDGRILVKCFSGCDGRNIIDALDRRGLWPERKRKREGNARSKPKPANASRVTHLDADRSAIVRQLWCGTVDPRGTWAEHYLNKRNLRLPGDPEILLRTLRFHPRCPWKRERVPALVCAFEPIDVHVPADPFLDPPVAAIHRIRGRGHDNKKMLGPVRGCAVMISPWWHVGETLHITEGLETALALYNEGAANPEDCHRPIWATGSAGAIRAFPIVDRVRRLVIWTDNDASGVGVSAARECARRWAEAGKRVVVRNPMREGADYADR